MVLQIRYKQTALFGVRIVAEFRRRRTVRLDIAIVWDR
jgi:hypothetical protein